MSSKGQGLSLSTIVIAVLVLIVLIILVMMTTGYFGNKFNPGFKAASATKCSELGGTPTTGSCSSSSAEKSGYFEDVGEGQKCCYTKGCHDRGGECKVGCSQGRILEGDWNCFSDRPACCKR